MTNTSACIGVVNKYLERLSSDFNVTPSDNGCFLLTPFSRPDGEGIELELETLPDGNISISDMGDTTGYLFVNGLTMSKAMTDRAKFISRCYGVSFDGYTLAIETQPDSAGDALHELIQAVLAVTDLIQMRRSTKPRVVRFDDAVESVIRHSGATYHTKYKISGRLEDHTFAFHVNSGRNLLVQPITAANASDAHAMAERWAYRFYDVTQSNGIWRPYAVLDDRAEHLNAQGVLLSRERVIWTPRAIAPISEYAITWAERDKLAALLEGKTL